MKQKIKFLCFVLITMNIFAQAQTSKILNVSPKGFAVEVEGHDTKQTYLSVNVKLQYSQIAEEDAGSMVLVSKTQFPMITKMDQLNSYFKR